VCPIGMISLLLWTWGRARSHRRPFSSACALMSADHVWYLDSSGIVKMVARDSETAALLRFLKGRQPLVSSALAITEVNRAVLSLGDRFIRQAGEVLERVELVRITSQILMDAGRLRPASLRSLDAIHLATAAIFADTLSGLITYDGGMYEAAGSYGWNVHAPA